MSDLKNKKLEEIFSNDPLGLLVCHDTEDRPRTQEEERLIDSFQEISDFYEEHGFAPREEGDLGEYMLYQRLQGIKANAEKVKILLPYDMYNLLESQSTKSVTIDDILGDDPLGLLSAESEDDSIFYLKHVNPSSRIRPEYIAHRKVCKDFDQYAKGFEEINNDVQKGRRKLVEYKRGDLLDGHYYVLRGVTFLLKIEQIKVDPKTYISGTYNRLDGRTKCIFDNGTESDMLYRSLEKAMSIDGFCISDPIDAEKFNDNITEDDVQNGYIYVLKSKSANPAIKGIKNLYKIGYCSGSVTERVKNARNEPTYLLSDVTILMTFRCFNMNTRSLETILHDFFGDSNVAFQVKDRDGVIHYPREWFIVPLDIIEEAVKLIVAGTAEDYRYDASLGKIIKRANR